MMRHEKAFSSYGLISAGRKMEVIAVEQSRKRTENCILQLQCSTLQTESVSIKNVMGADIL